MGVHNYGFGDCFSDVSNFFERTGFVFDRSGFEQQRNFGVFGRTERTQKHFLFSDTRSFGRTSGSSCNNRNFVFFQQKISGGNLPKFGQMDRVKNKRAGNQVQERQKRDESKRQRTDRHAGGVPKSADEPKRDEICNTWLSKETDGFVKGSKNKHIQTVILAPELSVSLYNKPTMFPLDLYLFPDYWPEDKKGHPCHAMIMGKTGSGKTNRMINMIMSQAGLGIPLDTLYYVTDGDKTSCPLQHLRRWISEKRDMIRKDSRVASLYDKEDQNFKYRIWNGLDFSRLFQMSQVQSSVLLKGKTYPNHTLVVVDDANVSEEKLKRLVQEGRGMGISLWVLMQDLVKTGLPSEISVNVDILMITSSLSRAPHIIKDYMTKRLGCSESTACKYHEAQNVLDKKEALILNSDNEKIWKLESLS